MSRQLDAYAEQQREKRHTEILVAVEGGLEAAVARAGGEFTGFAAKVNALECLLVIKAVFPGGPQVAFCGADSLGSALIKAVREAGRDRLAWRPDQYAGPNGLDRS